LVGGIPPSGNFRLRDLIGYRPSRFAGIVSSVTGFMLGLSWVRKYILLSGLEVVSPWVAAINIGAGLYLLIESLIRLGVTTKTSESLPSFPVWFLYWVTDRLVEWLSR
jgi:hypothetical protein